MLSGIRPDDVSDIASDVERADERETRHVRAHAPAPDDGRPVDDETDGFARRSTADACADVLSHDAEAGVLAVQSIAHVVGRAAIAVVVVDGRADGDGPMARAVPPPSASRHRKADVSLRGRGGRW